MKTLDNKDGKCHVTLWQIIHPINQIIYSSGAKRGPPKLYSHWIKLPFFIISWGKSQMQWGLECLKLNAVQTLQSRPWLCSGGPASLNVMLCAWWWHNVTEMERVPSVAHWQVTRAMMLYTYCQVLSSIFYKLWLGRYLLHTKYNVETHWGYRDT